MNIFTFSTPLTYWLLIAMWFFIFLFYIKRLRAEMAKGQLISVLLIILAIDAFRTLFESAYFGAWYTSLADFLPKEVYKFLVRPEFVFIPKIINVLAAGIVIAILIFRRLPRDGQEKDDLERLIKQRTSELTQSNEQLKKEINERKKIETDLKRRVLAMDNSSDTIVITDPDGTIIYVNPAFEKITGYSDEEALGEKPRILQSGTHDTSFYGDLWEIISSGKTWSGRFINKKKDGSRYTEEATISPVFSDKGEIINYVAVKRDISDRLKLETRLQQAHKMEAIGTLAGGIAHDFNNILFPIMGYTEMLLEDAPEDSPDRPILNKIYTGSLRARDLVQQILTFSRQESSELKLIKMQPIIEEALKLIRSSIPTTIDIKQNIDADCGVIKADPTQIHQIVMNIATNAYHAMMETGGALKVNLKEIQLDEHDVLNQNMEPRGYACLIIADTGSGMDKALIEKIFDPFFTTKEKGRGTGMGLSVVHGIVTGMGGDIRVYSEPGKGSEFKIYLPVVQGFSSEQQTRQKQILPGGNEHILLVDDEEVILAMEKQMLERLGYQVTSRTSSIETLEAFRANPDKFDLVITDMAMPNMPGDRLAAELTKIRPDIPILLCTGFSEIMSEEKAASIGIKGFLMKPIVTKDLAQKIRELLEGIKS